MTSTYKYNKDDFYMIPKNVKELLKERFKYRLLMFASIAALKADYNIIQTAKSSTDVKDWEHATKLLKTSTDWYDGYDEIWDDKVTKQAVVDGETTYGEIDDISEPLADAFHAVNLIIDNIKLYLGQQSEIYKQVSVDYTEIPDLKLLERRMRDNIAVLDDLTAGTVKRDIRN